jgi:murein DD-endopeptidase MepM/ murein hydrolase activator NlpD
MNLQYKYQVPQHLKSEKKSKKGKIFLSGLLFILIIFGAYEGIIVLKNNLFQKHEPEVLGEQIQEVSIEDKKEEENIVSCTIIEGDIPAEVFSEHGKFDANDTASLLAAAEEIYDFTNVKIGQTLRFYFGNEARAEKMEYDRDTEKMIIVERHGDDFDVHEKDIPYKVSQATVKGTIENFFYADALKLGMSEATVLEMGDIFSFSVDFTTEIREGDEFSVIYEKRLRDGEEAPDGRILAAKFINDGVAHYAYYFGDNDTGGYYDGEGRVLERQFLRAPLSYRRITSGYTGARMHPITRKITAHYQIDYAAPTGTPVVSTARGTVTSAGWEGGWGNMIRIRHDNGYTTHYGHLSGYASGIKSGAKVSQGQVVGYVGSTGWSTGPHLDFGMKLNGSPVNPLKLNLPKGTPLDEEKMNDFEENKKQFADLL